MIRTIAKPAPFTRSGWQARLKKLIRNTSLIAALEFALVAPIMIGLTIGTVDAGHLLRLKNHMKFHTNAVALDVALGNLSGAEAKIRLTGLLDSYADLNYSVTIHEPDPEIQTSTDVIVVATLPRSDVEKYSITGLLVSDDYTSITSFLAMD